MQTQVAYVNLDFLIAPAMAQAAPGAAGASPGGALSPLIMMGVVFLLMYFFVFRPQMKRAKEHRALMESIAVGDEVLTSGGLAGRVASIDDSFLSLEIASGVQVRLQKHAVSAVLPKGSLK